MSDLMRRYWIGDLELTERPFGVVRGSDTVDIGSAENVSAVVASALQDGDIVTSTGTGNRALVVPVVVEGSDLLELAANEAILKRACERARNTFTIDPGDTYGKPTVFDTFRIQPVRLNGDQYDEALVHRWDLTIPALPWARSQNESVLVFEPAEGDITELDDCSTLAVWESTTATLTLTTFEAAASVLVHVTPGVASVEVAWPGPPVTDDYVILEFATLAGSVTAVSLGGAGPVALVAGASKRQSLTFANPGGELTFTFDFRAGVGTDVSTSSAGDQVLLGLSSCDSLPPANVYVADIGGSVRTPGAVEVASPTENPIADLMIFSDPAMLTFGYDPSLPETWAQAPEGCYTVYARPTSTAGLDPGIIMTVSVGSQTCSTRVPADAFDEAGVLRWVIVGDLDLGGRRDGRLGELDVDVVFAGSPDPTADVRLFRRWSSGEGSEQTALTYLRGEVEGQVIVDIPSIDLPQGGVWVQEIDALDKVLSWEAPTMTPGQSALYVSDNGGPASALGVSLRYYMRWDGYAAG